jgi:hypothetical protein
MEPVKVLRRCLDPDDRIVTLTEDAWDHIMQEHPELDWCESVIMETVQFPDDRQDDPRPDRERYYSQGKGPSRYFCVVVEYIGQEGDVITAFGHRNDP